MKVFDAIKKHDTKGLMYNYLETIINKTATSGEEQASRVSEPQNKKKKILEALISPLVKESMAKINSNKTVEKYLYIAQPYGRTNKELLNELLAKIKTTKVVNKYLYIAQPSEKTDNKLLNELLAKTGSLNEVSATKDQLGNRTLKFNSAADRCKALQKLKCCDKNKFVGSLSEIKQIMYRT